jgi:hypothetical protein
VKKEPLKTSDTSYAAWLHLNGHVLVGLMQDPNDSHRKVFVFIKNDNSEKIERDYITEEGRVKDVTLNPRLYYKSIRVMHQTLKEGKIIREEN